MGGRFLDQADCKKTFKSKRDSKKKLSHLNRLKYSVCKRVWPGAYTEHILDGPGATEKYDANTTPKYRGHQLSRERRKSAKKSSASKKKGGVRH
jgi:hypothetical protein